MNDGKKIEKNFNNDLLEDKVEKINKILNWYKDDKVEYIEADRLREKSKITLKTRLSNNYLTLIQSEEAIKRYLKMLILIS